MPKIINLAIIAHVDHGKTTLTDHLLRQGGAFGERARNRSSGGTAAIGSDGRHGGNCSGFS